MRKFFLFIFIVIFSMNLISCQNKQQYVLNEQNELFKVKNVLTDYAIEFEDIKSIDDEKALVAANLIDDGWTKKDYKANLKSGYSFGCTAIMKEVAGKMLMSRNMDYILNKKTECVFKINSPDRYKSINVTNTSADMSDDFETIVKNGGVSDDEKNILAYFTIDGINEKGLTIEFNMRPTEYEEDGSTPAFLSNGTNPGEKRAPVSIITRLALDHCANIEELLQFIGAVDGATGEKYGESKYDFYTPYSEVIDWVLCFAVMDESGRKGVLEPINNKLIWNEDAKGQANFFLDKETEKKEKYGAGYGRWDKVMQEYDVINTEKEFYDLTKEISYSLVEKNEATWDTNTENTHSDVFSIVEYLTEFANANGIKVPSANNLKQTLTLKNGEDVILNIDNYKQYENEDRARNWTKVFVEKDETGEVKAKKEWTAEIYKQLTDEQARESNYYWKTAHHELYNATDKSLKIEFWETGEIFDFKLD